MIIVDPPPAVREAYKLDEAGWTSETCFLFEADVETWDKRKGMGAPRSLLPGMRAVPKAE